MYRVSPSGVQRGTETEIVIEGINLDEASRFLFSQRGVVGSIVELREVANKPYTTPRQQLRMVLNVSAEVAAGVHGFRLGTRFGTSNWVPFAIDSLKQIEEVEPNNGRDAAQILTGPITVLGTVSSSGEQDWFQFEAQAGEEFVFWLQADVLGSPLDSVITLLDSRGKVLATNNNSSVHHLDSMLGYRVAADGRYFVRVTDRARSGGSEHFYRLTMGQLPYVTHIFPLGVQRGTSALAKLDGFNLAGVYEVELNGCLEPSEHGTRQIKVPTPNGPSLNAVRIAVGDFAEILEHEGNDGVETAQTVPLPVTINGAIDSTGDQDLFRIRARRDQPLALEVVAHRLDSPLDAYLEVLDPQGRPVPRAVLQVVHKASFQLPTSSHSLQLQRLQTDDSYYGGDFVLLGTRELVRLEEGTTHSDDFSLAQGLLGRRVAWLGTSSQNHPEGFEAYRVKVLLPNVSPSGLQPPNYRLDYRNDDGGPVYGKDSYLVFTPPEDGNYVIRLRDLRRNGGRKFVYRLVVRAAKPDFRLFIDDTFMQLRDLRASGARNPNIPRGGRVPVVVSAQRLDGFSGEIEVQAEDLPAELQSLPETIRVNEFQTMLVLSASEAATEQVAGLPLKIVGRAEVNGRHVRRTAVDREGGLNLVSVVPPTVVRPIVKPRQITLEPGASAQLHVGIECPDDFAHEVGVEVKIRPPGVFVPGRSTNAGQAIATGERNRTLTLTASPRLAPMTFHTYVVIRFRSEQAEKMRGIKSLHESADYVSEPVLVTIKAP